MKTIFASLGAATVLALSTSVAGAWDHGHGYGHRKIVTHAPVVHYKPVVRYVRVVKHVPVVHKVVVAKPAYVYGHRFHGYRTW
jgi:hypothetical protein